MPATLRRTLGTVSQARPGQNTQADPATGTAGSDFSRQLRCPIRRFFFFPLSGHRSTAKIAQLPLPISTPFLGWEARPTQLGTHFVTRKAGLSELPKM